MLCRRQMQTLDFLSCAHRADGAGGGSDRPALLSLIAPDALLCTGSRTSSRSCLPSLCSLSSILSFGLGARRSCEETAAEERWWRGLLAPTSPGPGSILFLTWQGSMVCKPITCDKVVGKELNIFHARRRNQLSRCRILKDTSPPPWRGAPAAMWWERSPGSSSRAGLP